MFGRRAHGDVKRSAVKVLDHKRDSVTRSKHLRVVLGEKLKFLFHLTETERVGGDHCRAGVGWGCTALFFSAGYAHSPYQIRPKP